jgi:hypothetical protein
MQVEVSMSGSRTMGLDVSEQAAIRAVAALAQQGFGALTTIDVRAAGRTLVQAVDPPSCCP